MVDSGARCVQCRLPGGPGRSGSGYGSLDLLTRLQPDVVELDLELIRDVHRTPYEARVAEKTFDPAAELGSPVEEGTLTHI